MKKFLISVAFVALTSGGAFAQTLLLGGAVTGSTINSATAFAPQVGVNVVPQTNTSTQVNVSPSVALGVAAAVGVLGNATANAIPIASTTNTQRATQVNFSNAQNRLSQGVIY